LEELEEEEERRGNAQRAENNIDDKERNGIRA
jgi:hypothetical protein